MESYLAKRRKALNLTQKEVAEQIGVSEGTVSRWESGQIANMRRDRIAAYARVLQTSTDFIMNGDNEVDEGLVPTIDEFQSSLPSNAIPVISGHRIPVLGNVRCGLPMFAEENVSGYVSYTGNTGENYFALRACGDSMNAAGINDGDLVIVRQQDIVAQNEIAVVCVNGDEATLKRFRQSGSTVFLSPQSYNPVHQVQVYDLKNVRVHIMGRVMEVRKQF